jgi:hypothetical protein
VLAHWPGCSALNVEGEMSASYPVLCQSSNAIPKASWRLCLGSDSKDSPLRTGQRRHGVDVDPNYVLFQRWVVASAYGGRGMCQTVDGGRRSCEDSTVEEKRP